MTGRMTRERTRARARAPDLKDIKREVKQRQKGGWARIDWKLLAFEEGTPDTLQGRLVQADPSNSSVGFAQMTVRFKSKQTYAAYDARGRLVAGDPEEVLNVEDIWVFEHGLKLPNSRWRLAARLSLPAPGLEDAYVADDDVAAARGARPK